MGDSAIPVVFSNFWTRGNLPETIEWSVGYLQVTLPTFRLSSLNFQYIGILEPDAKDFRRFFLLIQLANLICLGVIQPKAT